MAVAPVKTTAEVKQPVAAAKSKGAFEELEELDFNPIKNKDDPKYNKEEEDNGLFVDNDFGDDFEDEEEDEKSHEEAANKDIFNDSTANKAPMDEEEGEGEDQAKMINEEFQTIYDNDP